MKAISLYQPWAGWVVEGRKTLELRSWETRYRGPLLIHASRTVHKAACRAYGIDPGTLPDGALVGAVEVVDIVWIDEKAFGARKMEHLASGYFEPPLYGWVLANPLAFAESVPWRGRPGLFYVADGEVQLMYAGSSSQSSLQGRVQ
jgi:hypothetical protein